MKSRFFIVDTTDGGVKVINISHLIYFQATENRASTYIVLSNGHSFFIQMILEDFILYLNEFSD